MKMHKNLSHKDEDQNNAIAIIGMSGRFPGADNFTQFWQNIIDQKNSITFFGRETLKNSGIAEAILDDKNYVKAKGVIEKAEWFDANFFGMPPIEAKVSDPQFRLFLECALEALESAGYDLKQYTKAVGVFATSSSRNNYYEKCILNNEAIKNTISDYQSLITNAKDFLATTVAYKLNCTGPAINIQTACSSSLVAICTAAQSLLNHECDLALAGGVSIKFPLLSGYHYQEGMIYSPDGQCRAFDKDAKGIVSGDGLGIVVLKRLSDALADNDYIYATIKGFAVNNDGNNKLGFTAPGIAGQAKVIRAAFEKAQIDPATVSYVEAHGTGTLLGDAVELAALTQAFDLTSTKCAIGSIKNNIGHLDVAAGVAGLIKTALAIKNHLLPPNINFDEPSADLADSPFYVSTAPLTWDEKPYPRRAGISSFGIGGTNAHVILEESKATYLPKTHRNWQLIVLSAKSEKALEDYKNNLASYLHANETVFLPNIAHTLQIGRSPFPYRLTAVCKDASSLKQILYSPSSNQLDTEKVTASKAPLVFMFPGFGSFKLQTGKILYDTEPTFRRYFDLCIEHLQPYVGDLKKIIFQESSTASEQLSLSIIHPALFAIEYALAKLWLEWGIKPKCLIGHSQGEYVAACLAGVFSLKDALYLVYKRSALIEKTPPGAMLVVLEKLPVIESFLQEANVKLAVINSPNQYVLAGEKSEIASLEEKFQAKGILSKRISDRYAFHSPLLQGIKSDFLSELSKIEFKAPQIPVVSNLTGKLFTSQEIQDPNYWAEHLVNTVNFCAGIEHLLQEEPYIFLEVGPGAALSSMVKQILACKSLTAGSKVIPCMPKSVDTEDESYTLLKALGKIWLSGHDIAWDRFHAEENLYRIPLPTYPYQRQHYHIVPDLQKAPKKSGMESPILPIDQLLYEPIWKKQSLFRADYTHPNLTCYIIFAESNSLGEKIAHSLRADGKKVITVLPSSEFEKINEDTYTINLRNATHYTHLFKAFSAEKYSIQIIHTWLLNAPNHQPIQEKTEDLDKGFFSLLYIAQALGSLSSNKASKIAVVTNGLYNIHGNEILNPLKATILGAIKVIPLEYNAISCIAVDIDISSDTSNTQFKLPSLKNKLIHELTTSSRQEIIAYRNEDRLVRGYVQNLNHTPAPAIALKHKGVYLITGGLGGMALEFAEFLAKDYQACLILISRTTLPPENEWENVIKKSSDPILVHVLQKLQNIKLLKVELLIISADIADYESTLAHIEHIEKTIGPINGVIHSAGIAGGGLIQTETKSRIDNILHAKVFGTLVLDRIFQSRNLDFMVLQSALTAITGGIGQASYVAANAFLDAYAEYGVSQRTYPVISLNWDVWQETGMAINTSKKNKEIAELKNRLARHPIFYDIQFTEGYYLSIDIKQIWPKFIHEHQLEGRPLIPATLYLELAKAAYLFLTQKNFIIFEQVHFIEPLFIPDEMDVSLTIKFKEINNKYSFSIESCEKNATQRKTVASGYISEGRENDFKYQPSPAVTDTQTNNVIIHHTKNKKLLFGPRWNCLQNYNIDNNQAYAFLKIPTDYLTELENFSLYPPMLDIALSFWLRAQENQYLPFSCDKLVIRGGLTSHLLVYCESKQLNATTMSADIHIFNSDGTIIAQASNMVFRRFN